MALQDAHDLFIATCKKIGSEHAAIVTLLANAQALDDVDDVLLQGGRGVLTALKSHDRALYVAISNRWKEYMDVALAYWGTQLTVPSAHVQGDKPTNLPLLLRDIAAEGETVKSRKVTWAAEPTPDDNGIIDRVTVDDAGFIIEGGLPATVDVTITSKPSNRRAVATVEGRAKGEDIFNLLGPAGSIQLKAINELEQGDVGNLVRDRNLESGINSTEADADVTALTEWTLGTSGGAPTHKVDRTNLFGGKLLSHKIYGASGATRTFRQPLIVADANLLLPQNRMLHVFKAGTPTGNAKIILGSKDQTFTIGSLDAGWNHLRMDRDKDLYPSQHYVGGALQGFDIECTTGDASNYVSIGGFFGQVYKRFNGPFWGHWSRNGSAAYNALKTLQDSVDNAGLNQTALYLAYHNTQFANVAYLPHQDDAGEDIADYS